MRGRHPILATWLALAVSAATAASAQTATATLLGAVVGADANPVAGAEVTVSGRRQSVRSNAAGQFRIAGLEPGAHTVAVRKLGYAALSTRVTLAAGDSVERRFNLGAPQSLDSVTVSAERPTIPEFEARRLRHVGYFITRAELEKGSHRKMGDFLRGVPGLRVAENPGNRAEAWAVPARGRPSIQGGGACYTQVYQDDLPVYAGPPDPPFNLNTLSTSDVEAVEYYAGGSSIPGKFNRTGSACGVLVIWTRR